MSGCCVLLLAHRFSHSLARFNKANKLWSSSISVGSELNFQVFFAESSFSLSVLLPKWWMEKFSSSTRCSVMISFPVENHHFHFSFERSCRWRCRLWLNVKNSRRPLWTRTQFFTMSYSAKLADSNAGKILLIKTLYGGFGFFPSFSLNERRESIHMFQFFQFSGGKRGSICVFECANLTRCCFKPYNYELFSLTLSHSPSRIYRHNEHHDFDEFSP